MRSVCGLDYAASAQTTRSPTYQKAVLLTGQRGTLLESWACFGGLLSLLGLMHEEYLDPGYFFPTAYGNGLELPCRSVVCPADLVIRRATLPAFQTLTSRRPGRAPPPASRPPAGRWLMRWSINR